MTIREFKTGAGEDLTHSNNRKDQIKQVITEAAGDPIQVMSGLPLAIQFKPPEKKNTTIDTLRCSFEAQFVQKKEKHTVSLSSFAQEQNKSFVFNNVKLILTNWISSRGSTKINLELKRRKGKPVDKGLSNYAEKLKGWLELPNGEKVAKSISRGGSDGKKYEITHVYNQAIPEDSKLKIEMPVKFYTKKVDVTIQDIPLPYYDKQQEQNNSTNKK